MPVEDNLKFRGLISGQGLILPGLSLSIRILELLLQNCENSALALLLKGWV